MIRTCYMCKDVATSVEHVPPRFLFPEEKDMAPGAVLRRNLMTVPSCDQHNTQKSKDDEYLVCVLVACQGANDIGQEHFKTKIWRAITRRPALINMILEKSTASFIRESGSEEWHETRRVELDESRFYGALEKIARAIYFHHWGRKSPRQVDVWPHFLTRIGTEAADVVRVGSVITQSSNHLFRDAEKYGENPDVFFFNAHLEDETTAIIRLVFYTGLIATITFRLSASETSSKA